LVAQRALLDNAALQQRLSHVFLFGTPSAGLIKAWFGALFKRQSADMRAGGPFITKLRMDWARAFSQRTPFLFRAVAGERDEFVPARSSIKPFPDPVRAVVPGNHVQIVKPDAPDHRSVLIVKQGLCGGPTSREVFDSARLHVELRRFEAAVKTLLPNAGELDDAALVALALALDGLGRGPEALHILKQHYRSGISSTDALGVLAGRLKRRWLAERRSADLARARQLYSEGLARPRPKKTRPKPSTRPSTSPFSISWPPPRLQACRCMSAKWLNARCNTVQRRTKTTGGLPPRRKPP
jgi:hypothetical protein